jgi:isopentenyl diphosphate isomerase/L-lactate dehydrogenase-like FMN-dependent dehydrogenase
MASPFLKAAVRSLEDTIQAIEEIRRQIQVCMFAAGAGDLDQLRGVELIEA